MKIKEIIKIVDGEISTIIDKEIKKISIDSRKLNKNDLFIAINSGNLYIEEALEKGAFVIGEEDKRVKNYIKVNNSIEALGKIAHHIRKQNKIPLIAITGSTGKTTTKELLYDILSKKYNVLKNEKNNNNHIGLPLTLTKIDNHDIIITELGMNHFGEISYLSKICNPNYAIITNIGSSHIGNLGSKKNILRAKLEILDGMENKYLLVNGDDKYLKNKSDHKVSLKQLKNIIYCDDKTEFDIEINNKLYHFTFPIPGKHLLIDVLLAINLSLKLSVDIEDIQEAVMNFKSENGRMNIIKSKYTIIDDCYNSSYESLKGSLNLLNNNSIVVLADILELGKYSKYYHKKINKQLKKIKCKEVLLLGEYTKLIKGKHFNNIDSLYEYLMKILKEGDTILIKGSNKFNLNYIVEKLK